MPIVRFLSDHTIPDFVTSPSDAIVTMTRPLFAMLGGRVQSHTRFLVRRLVYSSTESTPASVFADDAILVNRNTDSFASWRK